MAATKRNAMNHAEARQKIQTSQLINRLQGHAFGEVEMTKTQIRATEVLLRKVLPDLTSATVTSRREIVDVEDAELLEVVRNGKPKVTGTTPGEMDAELWASGTLKH